MKQVTLYLEKNNLLELLGKGFTTIRIDDGKKLKQKQQVAKKNKVRKQDEYLLWCGTLKNSISG